MTTYYHNPKCSKSRLGLEMLTQAGAEFVIKEYLKEPLSELELEDIFTKLQIPPSDVARKGESIYTDLRLADKKMEDKEWIKIIIENPQLLERPILVTKTKAIIGRPKEKLKELVKYAKEI